MYKSVEIELRNKKITKNFNMACICQYFGPMQRKIEEQNPNDEQKDEHAKSTAKTEVSATELANYSAENWLLKKKLKEAEIAIDNLETLVTTIMEKQHEILGKYYDLSTEHNNLQIECRQQREFHSMERNAMIRELQDVRNTLQHRTGMLADMRAKNEELTLSLQCANEKIYDMGIHFLKYKSARSVKSSQSQSRPFSEARSSCSQTPITSD